MCGLSQDTQLLGLGVFWKMGLRRKITTLIVSFIWSFGNNSHHMGKDAHPLSRKDLGQSA